MRRTAIFALGFMLLASTQAEAACESFSLSGEATPKFDGTNVVAIAATGVSNVRGENATDISNAMKSASLKARGALVRFMSQDVSDTQLLAAYNSTEEVTTGDQSVATQEDFEGMAEVIRSEAEDILHGATLVAECFDDERNLAFVTIGVSETVMAALGGFGETAPAGSEAAAEAAPSADAADGSFERRAPNADMFE